MGCGVSRKYNQSSIFIEEEDDEECFVCHRNEKLNSYEWGVVDSEIYLEGLISNDLLLFCSELSNSLTENLMSFVSYHWYYHENGVKKQVWIVGHKIKRKVKFHIMPITDDSYLFLSSNIVNKKFAISCSICCNFKDVDDWLSQEEYYRRLIKRNSVNIAGISHTLCNNCGQKFSSGCSKLSLCSNVLNRKIVLVEDCLLVTKLVTRILESLGYDVYNFDDPLKALNSNELPYADVVITDIVMPTMSGLEFIKNMKEMGINCPIICMSGCLEFMMECEQLGLAFLSKPITYKSLSSMLESITNTKDNVGS